MEQDLVHLPQLDASSCQALSDDLITLLDALIRRLGTGLTADLGDQRPSADSIEEGEEPQEPEASEEEEAPLNELDGHAIAEKIRRKVSYLLRRRLIPRLERAADELEFEAVRAAAQTAAVLKLIVVVLVKLGLAAKPNLDDIHWVLPVTYLL